MQPTRSFLFVTWEGGGNVPPVLGLASRLVHRGHRVRVLTEPCLREAVNAIGADFRAFEKHFNRTDPTVDVIQDSKSRPLSIPAIENVLVRPAMGVCEETRAALEEERTDVVVADFMMIGSLIAAEAMAIKRVALCHMPEYLPGPGRPPGGLGLLPGRSVAGRARDRLLGSLFDRITDRYLPAVNAVRGAQGLSALESFADIYHRADRRLIQTSEAFDAPITPAPANVRYVGPTLDDPGWTTGAGWADCEQKLWPKGDSRPLVVVGLSTTFQNQRSVLETIVRAVTGMQVRCLITLGPAMAKENLQVPDNVIVSRGVAHSEVFPHADVVVTHAGHGTVMRALAHGLPLVCLPMGRDQNDNAALVAHRGAGLKLSRNANSHRIGQAIKRVLGDSAFRVNARSLQTSVRADALSDSAVSELERLAT
jgi:MGT family glycosyltransferase